MLSLDLDVRADFFCFAIEEISLFGQISTLQDQILKAESWPAADTSQQAAQNKLLKQVNCLHEQYEAKIISRWKRSDGTGSNLAVIENLVYVIIIPVLASYTCLVTINCDD
jgi:hypothetical protein